MLPRIWVEQKDRGARHKGIGFKSVFLASQRPVVLSNGWSFCFDLAEGPLSSEKNAVEMPFLVQQVRNRCLWNAHQDVSESIKTSVPPLSPQKTSLRRRHFDQTSYGSM